MRKGRQQKSSKIVHINKEIKHSQNVESNIEEQSLSNLASSTLNPVSKGERSASKLIKIVDKLFPSDKSSSLNLEDNMSELEQENVESSPPGGCISKELG